jgi:hypothetical protein
VGVPQVPAVCARVCICASTCVCYALANKAKKLILILICLLKIINEIDIVFTRL